MSQLLTAIPDEDCERYALLYLGETPEVKAAALKEMRRWLEANSTHINAHKDPIYALYFLRGAKFDVQKAKQKIQKYYQMRAVRAEWFQNRDPYRPEIQDLLRLGIFLPLRTRDKENRLVVIIRTAAHDPKRNQQNDFFKVCKMILDLVLWMDPSVSIFGVSAIFDMKGVTLSHALALPPQLVKKSVKCWESYPCRPSRMEFANAPFHVNLVLDTFRFFMSAKMRSRVTVTYGNPKMDILQLPPELGGNGDNYSELSKYWKRTAEDNADWFVEDEKYKARTIDGNFNN